MKRVVFVALALSGVLLAACEPTGSESELKAAAASTSPSAAAWTGCGPTLTDECVYSAAPDPSEPDPVVEKPSESPTPEFAWSRFGNKAVAFTQGQEDGGGEFTVRITKPFRAICQYHAIGCDKPETGDRVVAMIVRIVNTGHTSIEIGEENFVLEFADGTRMDPGEGSASDYSQNPMDYSHKIRPGGVYASVLTFEAPKGAFSVIMLSNSYDGDDLWGWK